jgi:hypothetical protein
MKELRHDDGGDSSSIDGDDRNPRCGIDKNTRRLFSGYFPMI